MKEKNLNKNNFDICIGKAMGKIINANRKSHAEVADEINREIKKILQREDELEKDVTCNNLKIFRYINGNTSVPILVLLGFCRSNSLSIDRFFEDALESQDSENDDTENIGDTDSNSAVSYEIKNFLNLIFNNRDEYTFSIDDLDNKKYLTEEFFPANKNELELHIAFLKTYDKLKEEYQTGTLKFSKDNGICRVNMNLDKTSTGVSAEYSGFALFLNLASDYPECKCYLKRNNDMWATLYTISFRIMKNGTTGEWYARSALMLTTREADRRPLIHNVLLTKDIIDSKKLDYFKGYIKLNTGEIRIPKNIFKLTKDYIVFGKTDSDYENREDKTIINELKNHFEHFFNSNKERKSEAAEAIEMIDAENENEGIIKIIKYDNKVGEEALQKSLLLASWLRKNEVSDKYNRLFFDRDDDINKLLDIINEKNDSVIL